MKIEAYEFGKIVVEGNEYTTDLILYPDHVESDWWRNSGHRLQIDDIKGVIESKPDVLIVGTGQTEMMEISPSTRKLLKDTGIELIDTNTRQACIEFNSRVEKGEKVVGAFHLTC